MQYRSSKSRTTKRQEKYNLLSDVIYNYILSEETEKDAETLWYGMNEKGKKISHSTFNNRLRKLVDDGLIKKIPLGYNKYFYRASD